MYVLYSRGFLAKVIATASPFILWTVIAVWGILVLPGATGVKESVVDGTCRQPHAEISFAARPYTGLLLIDKQLCILVEIFSQSFRPLGLHFTQHLLWGLPSLIMIILFEGARHDRPWFFNSLLVGVLYQLWTIGLALSILWIPFVFTFQGGGARSRVSRGDAEGALVATLLGYYIPTVIMFTTKSAVAIALWQPFPIYIAIVQYIWSKCRSKGFLPSPAIGVQSALTITIITASVIQFYTLYPSINTITLTSIKEWLPIWTPPPGYIMPTDEAVRGFLQDDAFTAYGATITAGLLMMDSGADALLWLTLAPIGMMVLHPAGYIAAIWMKRERNLPFKKIE